jgi:catechol 2,3-dioxygenase-like lactoylglutathione lyase family enzyme
MLQDSQVTANIPAADLERARRFYADKLGLTPVEENPGGLIYKAGETAFFVYQTEYAGQAGHTIAQFHVGDVHAEVEELRSRGVTFEHYDLPGTTWDGDVATIDGETHAAWFKDSEDNILCLDDHQFA